MKFSKSLIALSACAAMLAAAPASAVVTTFTTVLSSAGEPVPTSTATGAAIVSFDDAFNSITVLLSFAGLANSSPFAHIHCCTAVAGTGSGPVVLNFPSFPAAATGSYVQFFPGAASFATLLAGASAGKAYVNIHTPGTYAGGEIRGFLAVTPIPEPGTYGLMLGGLAAVGLLARRRLAA
jgi:CHRD domain/PEP-CTERM motif